MIYDIDRIKTIISNFDPYDLMSSDDITVNAFLYALDCIIPVDDATKKLFLKAIKSSSYSTEKAKYIASIILQYPTILKKVILVDAGSFLKIPYLQLCFVKIPHVESFDLEIQFNYPDKAQFAQVKELSMRDTLKYMRDHYEYIIIDTPSIFLNDKDITVLEQIISGLSNPPTLRLD